jgi:hypothetical protein
VRDKIERQPISKDGQVAVRNAEATDLDVNELDYDYDIDINADQYPYTMLDSTQYFFAGVFYYEFLTLL